MNKSSMINQKHLEVKKSQIIGDGLYTNINIKKGDVISRFTGRKVKEDKIPYEESLYSIDLENGYVLNTYESKCYAKYANDCCGPIKTTKRNNSRITNASGRIIIYATKNISAGSEIFCPYGKQYWEAFKTIKNIN
jgi:SET domain-containing protein